MAFNCERFRITCCKDCPDRYPGCHAKCEKYIQQRAEYDAEKAELTRLIEESSDKLDMYKQDWKIQARARELGYRFPGDVNIDD